MTDQLQLLELLRPIPAEATPAWKLQKIERFRRYEELVAAHLRAFGVDGVELPELDVEGGPDHGDVIVGDENIEVKAQGTRRWLNVDDFPWRGVLVGKTFRVDAVEREGRLPLATVVVNSLTHGMLVVPRSSKPTWWKADAPDQETGVMKECYFAPKGSCQTLLELMEQLRG